MGVFSVRDMSLIFEDDFSSIHDIGTWDVTSVKVTLMCLPTNSFQPSMEFNDVPKR